VWCRRGDAGVQGEAGAPGDFKPRRVRALDFGRRLNINSHGPLGFAAISAPTLGEGIETLGAFARIRSPYVEYNALEQDRQLVLCFDTSSYPLGDLEVPLVEMLQQIAPSHVRAVLGEGNSDATLCFAYPARGHASLYREAFASRCELSAGFNGIALPSALKALPCPLLGGPDGGARRA
jgi:hypothetical protein